MVGCFCVKKEGSGCRTVVICVFVLEATEIKMLD